MQFNLTYGIKLIKYFFAILLKPQIFLTAKKPECWHIIYCINCFIYA